MVLRVPDSVFIKLKSSATDKSRRECNAADESCNPAMTLECRALDALDRTVDGTLARTETGTEQLPPWKRPRAVVESSGQAFKGLVSSAEYPALKKRLVAIPTRSAQSRQSLYRDKYTGQFWLGLRACIGSWSQQTEVLKPLGYEVAESLSASNRGMSDMMVH